MNVICSSDGNWKRMGRNSSYCTLFGVLIIMVPYFRKQPQENSKSLGAFGLPGWPTRIPRPGLFFVEAFRVLGFAVIGVLGCWVSGI